VSSDPATDPPAPAARRTAPLFRVLQFLAVALVVSLLTLLGWKVAYAERGDTLVAKIRAGQKPAAPRFDLPVIWDSTEAWPRELRPALRDGRIALGELRGYPVVINFWASWCDPCKEEAPLLAQAAARHAGEVVFLGLDVQDFTSDARRFLERYGANNYVSVRDVSNDVYDDYGLTGVPETFYLDPDGRAVAHSLGQISERELRSGIAQITGSAR
jgi:thiol-disulfide isomerase/thioredoxin